MSDAFISFEENDYTEADILKFIFAQFLPLTYPRKIQLLKRILEFIDPTTRGCVAEIVEKLHEEDKGLSIYNNLNSVPDEEANKSVNIKKQVNILRMNSTSSDDFEVEKDEFMKVLEKFSSKKTKSYDFLLKAGDKYKGFIYKLCKRMIDKEEFPTSFRKTILYQISKMKGPSDVLKNSRFIHIKDYLPRTCEALVMVKMKLLANQASIRLETNLDIHQRSIFLA